MKKRYFLKAVLVVFISAIYVNGMMANYSMASQSRNAYVGNYQKCLNESGGHENINSVKNYACSIASRKAINVCASWIGSSNNSKSTDIYANIDYTQINSNSTVDLKIWGMCTAVANTAAAMATAPPNIITCGGSRDCRFERSGNWGSPSSKSAQLNVSKFISGISPSSDGDYLVYTRNMAVTRTHSDMRSSDTDYSTIHLYVKKPPAPSGGGSSEPIPGPSCTTEDPEWHQGVDYEGNLSIAVSVTDARTWSSGKTIYARPTDEVVWDNDYYATTPGAADKQVAEVYMNGSTIYRGYEELSSSFCQPYGGMCAKRLDVNSRSLSDLVNPWQNQFTTSYSWAFGENDHTYGYNQNIYGTYGDRYAQERKIVERDEVGQTLTETAVAGTYDWGWKGLPSYIKINYSNPSQEVEQEVCTEENAGKIYYGISAETGEEVYHEVFGSCDILDPACMTPENYFENGEYEVFDLVRDRCEMKPVCTNSYKEAINRAVVEQDERSDSAEVKVPYNYNNYTSVEISNSQIFAGETATVSAIHMDVEPKWNNVTYANYATIVPRAKVKLFAYASRDSRGGSPTSRNTVRNSNDGCSIIGSAAKSGQCVEIDPTLSNVERVLNPNGDLNGSTSTPVRNQTYDAFDLSAGDYMCFVSAIWPASSGIDTQMEKTGDEMWRYSTPKCVIIAKKPTFQVWGGDMYSVGNLSAEVAQKRNIYREYINDMRNFNKNGGTITYFNPWVEQGLTIKTGTTTTIASGAATGLVSRDGTLWAGRTSSFCRYRSPLSFANICTTTTEPVGKSGINSATIDNRNDLLKYWLGINMGDLTTTSSTGSGSWSEIVTNGGTKIAYKHMNGDQNLTQSGTDTAGTTYLYVVDGTVTITGNIRYSATYQNARQIPKWIIYANNINIRCNVVEVDAILITKSGGTVNTCSNAGNNNASNRSNQLKIFGTVITDKIALERTYGGGATKRLTEDTYNDKKIPNEYKAAEIFDYDPTMLVWSSQKSSTAETSGLQVVYQKELAPRY